MENAKTRNSLGVLFLVVLAAMSMAALAAGTYMIANPRTVTETYTSTTTPPAILITTTSTSVTTLTQVSVYTTSTSQQYNQAYNNGSQCYGYSGGNCNVWTYLGNGTGAWEITTVSGSIVSGYGSGCTYIQYQNYYGAGSDNTLALYKLPYGYYPEQYVTVVGQYTTGACGTGLNIIQITPLAAG